MTKETFLLAIALCCEAAKRLSHARNNDCKSFSMFQYIEPEVTVFANYRAEQNLAEV